MPNRQSDEPQNKIPVVNLNDLWEREIAPKFDPKTGKFPNTGYFSIQEKDGSFKSIGLESFIQKGYLSHLYLSISHPTRKPAADPKDDLVVKNNSTGKIFKIEDNGVVQFIADLIRRKGAKSWTLTPAEVRLFEVIRGIAGTDTFLKEPVTEKIFNGIIDGLKDPREAHLTRTVLRVLVNDNFKELQEEGRNYEKKLGGNTETKDERVGALDEIKNLKKQFQGENPKAIKTKVA